MTRYGDPTRCPDCGSTLPIDPTACPSCGLPLTGPLAVALHDTLVAADTLLARLRAEALPAATPSPAPVTSPPGAERRRRRGLTAASVPSILLGLGALCLLVAAVTFLAVAWSWLGIGGRTAVLVALTLAAGGLGTWLAGRGLRIAGESLTVVGFGLLALDVVGADNAGWLGDPTSSGLTAVVGAVVGVVAVTLALVNRGALTAPQVTAVLAASVAALGTVGISSAPDAVTAGAVLVHVALAATGRTRALRVLATAGFLGAGAWCAALMVSGLYRVFSHPSFGELWLDLEAWPLLVAATVLACAAAALRALPSIAPTAGAVAAVLFALVLAAPAFDESVTRIALAAVVGLVLGSAALHLVPRSWALVPAAPLLLAVAPAGTIALELLSEGALTVLSVGSPFSKNLGVRLGDTDPVAHPAVLVPLVAGLVVATAAGRGLWLGHRSAARGTPVPGGTALALAAVATLSLYPVPLAVVVLGLVAVAVALVAASLAAGGRADHRALAAGLVGAAALAAALPSAWLTTVVLAVAVAAAAVVHAVGRVDAAGFVLPATVAGLVWSTAEAVGLDPAYRAAPVLVLVGLLALARPRPTIEAGAALAALVATDVAVPLASEPATSLALHLTVAGVLVTTSALVHSSRRVLAWPGGLLLAAATWVRLADLGVSEPEAYTLPSAVVLVLVGLRHLWRHPGSSSRLALGPGLSLATVPSLLVVLVDDPVSLRAALLGAGCFGLLMAGTRLHWSAPLVVGATVGGVLVLRELAPYAGETPQWVMIGMAGTALTLVGITWEHRMRDLHEAAAYLARLR